MGKPLFDKPKKLSIFYKMNKLANRSLILRNKPNIMEILDKNRNKMNIFIFTELK